MKIQIGLVILLLASSGLSQDAKNKIEIYSRAKGNYVDDRVVKPQNFLIVNLDSLKAEKKTLFDVQYEQKQTYRGVSLSQILAKGKPAAHDDYVLLHFHNEMIVPFKNDPATVKKLNLFVATSVVEKSGKPLPTFPPVAKKDEELKDPRPITFSGNKLVASSMWHPNVKAMDAKAGFSPWLYTDSLKAIEFVNKNAYYKQFGNLSSSGAIMGFRVFQNRCQYCHGARHVGAGFGWDYVDPLPIYEKRDATTLLYHVKYPKWDALKRGLMMPAQKGVTDSEVNALWQWLKTVATSKMLPYQP